MQQINRRDFLKSISYCTSGFVLAPLATQAMAQAEGLAGQTQRFVFVVKSSGLTPAEVVPQSFSDELVNIGKAHKAGDNYTTGKQLNKADKLINRPLEQETLHPTMSALEPFKDRLCILQGLSGQMVNGGHTSGYGAMSCIKGNGGSNHSGTPVAETIDAMMSRFFPSVFNHLGLSIPTGTMVPTSKPAASVCYPGISAAGAGKALPFQGSPIAAHRSLFGSVSGGDAKAEFDLSSRVFEAMSSDIKRLMKNVGPDERDKLQFHLDAIQEMDRRRELIAEMGPQLKKAMPPIDETFASVRTAERLSAHFDVAAGALIAGLTNVVTIRADGLSTDYSGLGIEGTNVHGIGHGKTPENFNSPDHARGAIRELHLNQIARLAGELDKIPEGDGTMLDNTTILYFSDVGDKHHASNIEWPYIVVGDVGGKLKTAGRYIQYPAKGTGGHHTIANWWMTLLHAVGQPTDSFGMTDAKIPLADQKGPLAELLA